MISPLRQCRECGKIATNKEELILFVKNLPSLHERQNLCKSCFSKNQVTRRTDIQTKVDEVKATGCVDCGGIFNSVAMDFDHVRGEKKWTIALGIRKSRLWEEIKEEITKCDLVCANCHRVRTWASDRHYPNTGSKGGLTSWK